MAHERPYHQRSFVVCDYALGNLLKFIEKFKTDYDFIEATHIFQRHDKLFYDVVIKHNSYSWIFPDIEKYVEKINRGEL